MYLTNKWEKVLYKKSTLPDNNSDGFLTELQTNLNIVHYTLWEAVIAASTFMCQVDMVVAYFCVFEFVQINAVTSGHLALLTILLLAICETIFIIYNIQFLTTRSAIYDHLRTALTFLLFGFGFTPVIRTLTTTISTDTIYAVSMLTFGSSLVFHDYGANVAVVNTPLSVNLCLAASVFLISRIGDDLNAFFMLSLSVCLFSFWPTIRNYLFSRFWAIPLICMSILAISCSFALLLIVPELIGLFAVVHLIRIYSSISVVEQFAVYVRLFFKRILNQNLILIVDGATLDIAKLFGDMGNVPDTSGLLKKLAKFVEETKDQCNTEVVCINKEDFKQGFAIYGGLFVGLYWLLVLVAIILMCAGCRTRKSKNRDSDPKGEPSYDSGKNEFATGDMADNEELEVDVRHESPANT
ncbi:hypothetical protein M3Y97_00976100 [Aphelenchoides bicaudatus]|nr:hypothetical protein M3Y97_00976100 [Aphelenchoides bicaudatus]